MPSMIHWKSIAFCAGLAWQAWCGTAEAQPLPYCSDGQRPGDIVSGMVCEPVDAAKVEIDGIKDRVTQLEGLIRALLSYLPKCKGEPPEHLPCIEREDQ